MKTNSEITPKVLEALDKLRVVAVIDAQQSGKNLLFSIRNTSQNLAIKVDFP